jgi:hypothetical protein
LHAEKAGWSPIDIARATAPSGGLPRVDFGPAAETCPACGGSLCVSKTKTRTVITLAAGPFAAREVWKRCACGTELRANELATFVRSHQRYGYDLIVHVGLARYLRRLQRTEIRHELRCERGIELSTGTISALCDRFLAYLGALHVKRAPELRAVLQEGGYPLHIDATCEHGKGGLFLCIDGWRNWVLWSSRIPSENAEILCPVVQKTTELFGNPVATVRDLGEGGAGALAPLREQGIPDLVCHYHFLGAVGKQLFGTLTSNLRDTLRLLRVRSDLRTLLRDIRRYEGGREGARFGPGRIRTELAALVLWVLDGDGTKDDAFPFSLPYLDFVRRCQQVTTQLDGWVPRPRTNTEWRAIKHMQAILARLDRDTRIAPTVQALEERWYAFNELRDVLRLSQADLPRGDRRAQQVPLPAIELLRLEQIKVGIERYRDELRQRIPAGENPAKPKSTAGILLKYLRRYGPHLFGHPARRDEDGNVTAVVDRTNNVAEHFFGDDKQRLRRRLGRAQLARDLEQQPAQVALTANLRHPSYVRVLCGSLENLPAAMAGLDATDLERAPALVRDHRDKELEGLIEQQLGTRSTTGSRSTPTLRRDNERLAELAQLSEHELDRRRSTLFAASTSPAPAPDPRLPPPGTILKREYGGKVHRVTVLENGFEYRRQHYEALSPIANQIAGGGRNGFAFFRLKLPPGATIKRRRRRSRGELDSESIAGQEGATTAPATQI